MNERIKELAKQATKHYPATESSGEFSTFDKEKFAELIVRECMKVGDMPNSADGMYDEFLPSAMIAKHFGVEL